MKHIICRLLLFVFISPLTSFGQTPSITDTRINRVEQGLLAPVVIKGDAPWSLEERMKHYKVPGLSIAVIKDFKIDWAKAYGVKDVETAEKVTTDTIFQAASISKPVAAMVALKKVEEGKISLDENINNKLVSWKLPENEFTATKKVTLANLLSHTAGTTVHGFPGYEVSEKIPTPQQVLDGVSPTNTAPVRVNLEPGTKFRYSGGGITIAQLAIMDIEKKPYPEIAQETVLARIGMTNSTYSQPLSAEWRKKAASGHRSNGRPIEGKIHVYPEMAAAGLWTTPTDLAKFAIETQLSLVGRSNKVLKKESVEKMTTAFLDNVGQGFFIEPHGKALYFGHGGANEGFRCELVVSRDKGYGVAVMVNSDNGQILREVVRSVAQEYGWDEFIPAPYIPTALTASQLTEFSGRFQVNPDRVFTVSTVNGKLYAQPTADPSFELVPISDTTFVRRETEAKYVFTRSADKAGIGDGSAGTALVEALKIQAGPNTFTANRISAAALVPYELLLIGKTAEAIAAYQQIKKDKPDNQTVSEGRLNGIGYTLMSQKKLPEAIAILKLNAELYPQSANVYDSLGEAYMTIGDKELAIANYKKSLELNPKNANGAAMLKKLEAK
ncbi:MAG TPA: serine hydrolase [Pyrinomonadaceae bacterium]|nr:serine hydrolase [Pyrinomonadaceae bacterium]